MDDYISKPIRLKELAEALIRVQSQTEAIESADEVAAQTQDNQAVKPEAVDAGVLNEFETIMGSEGAEMVVELITLFLEDAPPLLADLQHGAEQEDAQKVRRAAHTLKSSAANLGALELSKLCQELETLARANDLNDAPQKVRLALEEYARVKVSLKAELQKRSVAPSLQH